MSYRTNAFETGQQADPVATTGHEVPGHEIVEILGIVRGSGVFELKLGSDHTHPGTTWTTSDGARNHAAALMIQQAKQMQADAVTGVTFDLYAVLAGTGYSQTNEVLVYGTAVRLVRKQPQS